ncbi:MAG: chemotaxis protein CheW [Devosia sp.]|nr:chemotaxis protein CheW [Devosia sp.]
MSDVTQYVTLGIGDELLALPVESVREILEVGPIARLPHAPDDLLGMVDVRGQGVPVVDLRLKLGFGTQADTDSTRIIVLDVALEGTTTTLGLKADRVFEVTTLDASTLDAPPQMGGRWPSDAIEGIGRRDGRFVTVLSIANLFGRPGGLDGPLDAVDAA